MDSSFLDKSRFVALTRHIPELAPLIKHCPIFDNQDDPFFINDLLFVKDLRYALLKIHSYDFPSLGTHRGFARKEYLKNPREVSALFVTKNDSDKQKKPCLLLSHGSGGNTASEWQVARKLMDKFGFAVLILDHYTQRGIRQTIQDQFQLSIESQMIDLAEAKKFVEKLPFIDSSKIIIAGVSRGGTVVDRLRRTHVLRTLDITPFSAYICFYPLPHSQEITPKMAPSPALYIVGDQDDITPLKVLKPYLDYLEAHGINSELHVAKGAYHAFEYPGNGKLTVLNWFYRPTQNLLLNRLIHKLAEFLFEPHGIVPMHKLQILKESCYIYDEKGYFPLDKNCSIPKDLDFTAPRQSFTHLIDYVKNNVTYGGRVKRADDTTKHKAYEALYRFLEIVLS